MARLNFGIRCSAFNTGAKIKVHIKKYNDFCPEVFDMSNNSMFVDDLYYGANTENAYNLSLSSGTVLKEASMNLRKFNSNSKELKELWQQNGISDNPSEQSVLLELERDTNKDIIKIDSL